MTMEKRWGKTQMLHRIGQVWKAPAPELPRRPFISHAYRDIAALHQLLKGLPRSVRPVVFPPITVPPDKYVSEPLVSTILECDGLIYLTGPATSDSFWVAFERDTAARAARPLFRAKVSIRKHFLGDRPHLEITRDTASPLNLQVFVSHANKDFARVKAITEFMAQKRHFTVYTPPIELSPTGSFAADESALRQNIELGFVVVFWSEAASQSGFVKADVRATWEHMTGSATEHLIFAQLDSTPLPTWDWLNGYLAQESTPVAVQLFTDEHRSMEQRIDDLIVRLYWSFYGKTKRSDQ